jgi:hypothetical protein
MKLTSHFHTKRTELNYTLNKDNIPGKEHEIVVYTACDL